MGVFGDSPPSWSLIRASWKSSTDNIGVTEYDLYSTNSTTGNTNLWAVSRGNISAGSDQQWANNVSRGSGLGATYAIYIVAVDAAGNVSQPSPTLSVTVPD